MGMKKSFAVGLLLGFLTGCGTLGFSYKFYGIQAVSYEGKLLGPKSDDDIPFEKCKNNGCVAMLKGEFFKLKSDYEQTSQKLKDCEKK